MLGANKGHWLRVNLPGRKKNEPEPSLRGRIHLDEAMRQNVEAILRPGTTVAVTANSLAPGDAGRPMTVIETDGSDQTRR